MSEGHRSARHARKQAIRRKAQRRHSRFYENCSHWSFSNHSEEAEPIRWHRERWMLAGTAFLITLLSGFILPAWATAMRPPSVVAKHAVLPLALPKAAAITAPAPPPMEEWHTMQVRPGQTLSDIFQAQGLSLGDLQRVVDSTGDAKTLRNIRPGQEFDFLLGSDGSLKGVRFDKDEKSRTVVRFDGATPVVASQSREVEEREHLAHGVIDSSLFAAGAKAGLSNAMTLKLADLFKYDVDFAQDLQEGDSFTVIYDDVYQDGSFLHEGDIVAAEFVNQGQRYTAYRFKKANGDYGWFSEDGRPIQKSFLRIPVDFTRISSTFSAARFHPILGLMRAHKGVDYAAPTGTPIHAAGDGVIKYRGWMNGYGNFVVIQHNNTISTAYGHMSRFAPEKIGQHVTQGQVIGFVGMTGLATGPHLHYEFRVNNVQRDPQTVTLPKPEPMSGAMLAKFKAQVVQPELARLKTLDENIKLAQQAGHTAKSSDN